FSSATLEILSPIADQIALGIKRWEKEGELAESATRLRRIMESVPDILYTLDCEHRLVEWNRRLEEVSGLSRDEIAGRPLLDLLLPRDRYAFREATERALKEGYAQAEARIGVAGDRAFAFHWTGAALRDSDGRVLGITGVGRDVTERDEAQRSIVELSGRLL